MRAVVEAGHFDIVSDEPASAGGGDTGPTPTDLFLTSIASCFVLAMAWAARRAGHELPDLGVRVVGSYDGPRFSRIEVEISCTAPSTVVEQLIPEAERVCYVTNSLRDPPQLYIGRVVPEPDDPDATSDPHPGRTS